MAITYPLTPPAALEASSLSITGISATSRNVSPFTLQTQQYHWPGQGWLGSVECPPMQRAEAEQVLSFLLSAQRGTFYFGDYANPTARGNVTGTLTVSSATANTTTLGISGATGSFAVGDWLANLDLALQGGAGQLVVLGRCLPGPARLLRGRHGDHLQQRKGRVPAR
jgi:hypothetical protein